MMIVQQTAPFSGLHLLCVSWYSFAVAAKSAAGRRNPCISKATQHAPGVFFYVAAFACSFFARWMLCYRSSQSMVAQAGQPKGWPVSFGPVFSPPSGLPPLRA